MTVQSNTFHVLFIIQMIQASSPAGFTDIAFLEVVPQLGNWYYLLLKKTKYILGVSVLP